MPETTNGAPYPSPSDPNNIPADLQALAEWADEKLATAGALNDSIMTGVAADSGSDFAQLQAGLLEEALGDFDAEDVASFLTEAAAEDAVDAKLIAEDILVGSDQRAPKLATIRSWLFPDWAGGIRGPGGRAWMGFLDDGTVEAIKLKVTSVLEVAGMRARAVPQNVFDDQGAIGGPGGRSWLVFRSSGKTTIHLADDSTIPTALAVPEVAAARGTQVDLSTRLGHGLDQYGAPLDYAAHPSRMRWTRMLLGRLRAGDTGTQLAILLIGDSYTQNKIRWSGAFWKVMKTLFGDGGVGWVGFSWPTGSPSLVNGSVRDTTETFPTATGTWTPNYQGTKSPDLGELASSTPGDTVVVTFPAGQTTAKLHYIVAAGATATAQFNSGGSSQALDLSLGGSGAGTLGIVTLTAPPFGATALTITVTAGTVTLCGVDIRKGDGIIVHKIASTGSRAQQWAAAAATTSWRAGIASLGGQLAIVMLGANDQTVPRTAAAFAADLTTIFGGLDAAMGALAYDRVLMMPPENQRGLTPTMADYAAATQPIADAADAVFVNLQPVFGNAAADYAPGSARPWFNVDLLHPEPLTGGRVIVDTAVRIVTTR